MVSAYANELIKHSLNGLKKKLEFCQIATTGGLVMNFSHHNCLYEETDTRRIKKRAMDIDLQIHDLLRMVEKKLELLE
jgi:hypothetical protein